MKGRRKGLIGYVGSNLPIRIGFRGNVGCKKKTFRFNIIYLTSHWVLGLVGVLKSYEDNVCKHFDIFFCIIRTVYKSNKQH